VKGKLVTMIGIAGVFGAISIFAADMWLKSAAQARVEPVIVAAAMPEQPAVNFRTIVVAREPLRFGAELTEAQLTEIPWAEGALPEGASEKVAALLSAGGRVVLSPIAANEPVLFAKLSGPGGRATLSNLLSPGMRAVTIRIDEIAGVGGFVTPGDRVDVVMTRDAGEVIEVQGAAEGAAGSTIATEVVVQNAKVLSVGQDLNEGSTTPQVANSVTLEVTPEDAGKVALARNVGTLSLSLRSAGEAGALAGGLTTISSFLGSVGRDAPVAEAPQAEERSIFAMEPEKKFKTVVVTRGVTTETYQVPAPQN
jgi:pilus assembly protein CpaB